MPLAVAYTLPAPTSPAAFMPKADNFRVTAVITASALFMEQLDSTVLNTALPAMARTFHVSPLDTSVALTSYLLSLAVCIPASGAVADRFGARSVFCAAIALFTLSSMLCAQANSLGFLVVSRLLQGVGGAMMVPVGRLILLQSVPKAQLIAANAWFLVPVMIGPLLGPPVGGAIVTYLSWRWIFYINLPVGIAGIGLALVFIKEVRLPFTGRFDWVGLVLSGVALGSLIFGLELIGRGLAPGWTMALPIAGLVSGAAYLWHAKRYPTPILDVGLTRIPTFALSLLAGSLTRITAGALPFMLPLMMQLGFGMSAVESGAITFTGAAGAMLMKATAPMILRRMGFRRTLIWNGFIATGFVAVAAAFRPGWPIWGIDAVLLLGGFFQSLQFTAYNTIAYADIALARMSAATAFYSTFQQLMLSVGICVSAGALHLSMLWTGHDRALPSDFSAAFLLVTAISLFASPICALLPTDAGAEISGQRVRQRPGNPTSVERGRAA